MLFCSPVHQTALDCCSMRAGAWQVLHRFDGSSRHSEQARWSSGLPHIALLAGFARRTSAADQALPTVPSAANRGSYCPKAMGPVQLNELSRC